MLSPRTFNHNYLENQYKKMEIQEQAAYIELKDRELMLEQLKVPQGMQQQDIPQIPGAAPKDPSVSLQEDSVVQ